MPIYEYRCESCDHKLEKLQKMSELINANPIVYSTSKIDLIHEDNFIDEEIEDFHEDEIWHLIRDINDPEHPVI